MAKKTDRVILITRFSALGDIAMSLPVIYDVCRANPNRRFVMLTRKLPASMFINRPENLAVEGVDLAQYKGAYGMFRLLHRLRRDYALGAIADLHDVLRTKMLRLIGRLCGMKIARVDKGREQRKRMLANPHQPVAPLTHMSQRYRDVFKQLGLPATEKFTTLFPSGCGDDSLFREVSAPKKDGETWIAVAPFAAHKGKVYPLEKMREVVRVLASRKGYRLFIFGSGAEERKKISGLCEGFPNAVSLAAHKIGLEGELALMSRCDIMIAMDSANMHLASLAGLPCVSIWGATHPFAGFYGFRQDMNDAVQLPLDCRPCSIYGNKPCSFGDYRCLRDIRPETVVAKVDSLLGI